MPKNKQAFIRYICLDQMLSNRNKYYTTSDLHEKCNEFLESEGYKKVSKRTIELDLNDMELLPFNFDIEIDRSVIHGRRIVRYKDQSESIFSKQLSDDEKQLLSEVLNTLGQFSGLNNFEWLGDLQEKLNDKKAFCGKTVNTTEPKKVISFSSNPYLKNQSLLGYLFFSISNKKVISFNYRKFNEDITFVFTVYPYLLKQYLDRWYLICNSVEGMSPIEHDGLLNIPLDRIEEKSIKEICDIQYQECSVDLDERFDDIVGVSYRQECPVTEVLFAITKKTADYIRTKPIHSSQVEIKGDNLDAILQQYSDLADYAFFKIKCIPNDELFSLLCSYGKRIIILHPATLKEEVYEEAKAQMRNYELLN